MIVLKEGLSTRWVMESSAAATTQSNGKENNRVRCRTQCSVQKCVACEHQQWQTKSVVTHPGIYAYQQRPNKHAKQWALHTAQQSNEHGNKRNQLTSQSICTTERANQERGEGRGGTSSIQQLIIARTQQQSAVPLPPPTPPATHTAQQSNEHGNQRDQTHLWRFIKQHRAPWYSGSC
jgi:hypothetical protein